MSISAKRRLYNILPKLVEENMKSKALNRIFKSVLATVLSASMLPVSSLAANIVKPEPALDDTEDLTVEYFSTTFIDYDQTKTNQATKEADLKSIGEWENKQNGNIHFTDLTNVDGDYQSTEYYIRLLADDAYYPAVISRTTDRNEYIYKLYYQAQDDSYVWIDSWKGNNPEDNYPVDKPGSGEDDFGNGNNNADNSGKLVYNSGNNKRVNLYHQMLVQEGKGFYFTGDTGNAGKPTDAYIPLYSATWGKGKCNGPAIGNDPNNKGQDQDFYIYTGLAAAKLSESINAPFANDITVASGFFSTDPTVGTDYRTVYTNVGVPYVYDEETGNYTLNSDKNAVYFAGGKAESNTKMKIADLPSAMKMNGTATNIVTGLTPFVDITNTVVDATESGYGSLDNMENLPKTKAYMAGHSNTESIAKQQLFAFGMVTEVKFQMTDDGKSPANGDGIKFTFSGDDDVWVYIDGVLALDIGGVHDAIQGEIDFSTGAVTVSAKNSRIGKVGDRRTNMTMDNRYTTESIDQGNIYDKLDTTLTGFASQGEHTLTIYYMERGEGKTNCLIQFNLPQRDTVEVTKKLDYIRDEEDEKFEIPADDIESYNSREFGFTLYENENVVANKTYYVYDTNNNLIRTASTDDNGHFTLKRNETARFLVNIAQNSQYQVIEDGEVGIFLEPTWTYTTNIEGIDAQDILKSSNGFGSKTITVTGSDTTADSIRFVCENFIAKKELAVDAQDKRIVIDYGLPIEIPVSEILANDIIKGDSYTVEFNLEDSKYGNAVYNDNSTADDYSDDTITYTLNKQLTGIETFTYTVTVTGEITGGESSTECDSAQVLIMPATSMYYEEDFGDLVTYYDGNVKWIKLGEPIGSQQETGFVGTADDSTYGSDKVYLNNIGDSYGTCMMANANSNYATKFDYNFTGTGTAIYGRISDKTGYIRVTVTADSQEQPIDQQFIDTVVLTTNGGVGSVTTLYNIPIYLNEALSYGDYHVEVLIYRGGTPTATGVNGSGSEFYLDGIKIYDPMGINADDYNPKDDVKQACDIVRTAYADDGEANTVVVNIKDKILNDITANFFTLTDVNGAPIDNEGGDIANDKESYNIYGPNNEFYLDTSTEDNKVYTVSFSMLNWDSKLYDIYLGMKAPAGDGATTVVVGGRTIYLNNSTDCYYNISEYVTVEGKIGTVTITGDKGLVSLTNIKVVGAEGYEIVVGNDEEVSGTDDREEAQKVYDANKLYLVPTTFSLASDDEKIQIEPDKSSTDTDEPDESDNVQIDVADSKEDFDNEASDDETKEDIEGEIEDDIKVEICPDAELFIPEQFKANCTYAKSSRTATIMVYSSKDVSSVTVNGDEIAGIKVKNSKLFISIYNHVDLGETFDVIAFDKNGNASEVYTIMAE